MNRLPANGMMPPNFVAQGIQSAGQSPVIEPRPRIQVSQFLQSEPSMRIEESPRNMRSEM